MRLKFPKGFLFGAATSSHQVEGYAHNDWSKWEERNAVRLAADAESKYGRLASWWRIKDRASDPSNYLSGTATDHYRRYESDFDLAKELGHNAHRFSIEWSRVEPNEGRFDEEAIAHYRGVARALRKRGMEPFVTIWHFALPLWLMDKGGVLAKDFPDIFARYAAKLAAAFESDVHFWITMNEPEIYSLNGYKRGIWPPGEQSIVRFYRSMAQLIRAHRKSYAAVKAANPDTQVGAALNLSDFKSGGGPVNHLLAYFARRAWNEHFLRHTLTTLDFVGLNYYFLNRLDYGFNKNPHEKISDLGWDLHPAGIWPVLRELAKFKKPIYVTENGLADAEDRSRAWFIRETFEAMAQAMRGGADLRGYFHWSLLDNFEWDKGFWPRFGLIEINYATQERRVRQSAREYAKLIGEYSAQ